MKIKVGQMVLLKKDKELKRKYRGSIGKVVRTSKYYVTVDWGGGQINTAVFISDIAKVWDIEKKVYYLYVCYPISRTIFVPKLSAVIDMEEMESFTKIEDAEAFMKSHYASYVMAIEKCDEGLHKEVSPKKSKYCQCGGSPCMLRNTNTCVHCKKPIKPGVYY